MELGATTIQMITTKEGWCMCNESRDCKLKGSLKGYVHSTMQCCACQNIIVFPRIVSAKNYSFLNLEIVKNSNSCHKFQFFT